MLESIEPIVPWSHTIRGVQGTIGTIGKKARLRSRPLEAARGKLHDGGTSAAAAALLACGALLLLRVGDGEPAACGGLCGRTRSPFPPIFSHVFPLRVYSCVYMYRPIMYRPTCIVRRYMYRTTYTRGLGSHKPIVRVVGRQEDVRGRRIHVLPCVLP